MRTRHGFIAVASAAAFALAACGGGGSTTSTSTTGGGATSPAPVSTSPSAAASGDVQSFVTTICTGLTGWQNAIQQQTNSLKANLPSDASADQRKTALGTYLDGIIQATQQLVQQVQSAGPPPIQNGAQAQQELAQAFQAAVTGLQAARSQVDNIPTGNDQAFQAAANALGDQIQKSLTDVGSSLSNANLNVPELDQEFNQNPNCSGITST